MDSDYMTVWKIFFPSMQQSNLRIPQQATPCSYNEYCASRMQRVCHRGYAWRITGLRILRTSFWSGLPAMATKQVTVEYQEKAERTGNRSGCRRRYSCPSNVFYRSGKRNRRARCIRAIILFKNTSAFHEKEQNGKRSGCRKLMRRWIRPAGQRRSSCTGSATMCKHAHQRHSGHAGDHPTKTGRTGQTSGRMPGQDAGICQPSAGFGQ